jgi:hypothetical protein
LSLTPYAPSRGQEAKIMNAVTSRNMRLSSTSHTPGRPRQRSGRTEIACLEKDFCGLSFGEKGPIASVISIASEAVGLRFAAQAHAGDPDGLV